CGSGARSTNGGSAAPRSIPLAVYAGGKRIEVARPGRPHSSLQRRVELRRAGARLELAVRLKTARRRVRRALAAHEARVDLPVVPIRSTIALPPIRQVLHNDCEATSLSMLLVAAGIHAGQLRLQARLPRSGPP